MTHIVLLRGINVGAAKRISMASLREVLERIGCGQVRTYLQSGNAVVSWDGTPAALEQQARAALEVGLLAGAVDPAKADAIDHTALAPERLAAGLRSTYLYDANGVQRSALCTVDVGGGASIARNRTTVLALQRLASGTE